MILSYTLKNGETKMIRLKSLSAAKPITIGRGEEADITIDDSVCSRIHSAIRYWDDIFVIRDMKSRNGTLVNGNRIKVAQLDAGDVIKIGNTELRATAEEGSKSEVTIQP